MSIRVGFGCRHLWRTVAGGWVSGVGGGIGEKQVGGEEWRGGERKRNILGQTVLFGLMLSSFLHDEFELINYNKQKPATTLSFPLSPSLFLSLCIYISFCISVRTMIRARYGIN